MLSLRKDNFIPTSVAGMESVMESYHIVIVILFTRKISAWHRYIPLSIGTVSRPFTLRVHKYLFRAQRA